MSDEFKPCPFCGCHGVTIKSESNKRHTIECDDCPGRAEFFSSDRDQAIEAWNRRSAPAGITNKDAELADVRHCWSCKRPYWSKQAIDGDGFCPHCGVEIEPDSHVIPPTRGTGRPT